MERRKLEAGQGITEYAFLYVFIAILLLVVLVLFGDEVRETYQFLVDTLVAVFTS
jgi:Flp pilus assembly pilin Flp